MSVDTAVLDVDGTLVDSVYAHVWSFREAFRMVGLDVPTWQVHRAIGMGKDKLVPALTSRSVETALGDEIRRHQAEQYEALSHHLRPTPGAAELLAALKSHGLQVALASSGSRDSTSDAIDLLDAADWVDGWVSGEETDESKPSDDPIQRAIDAVGGDRAFVVGDAVWDMQSARENGRPAVGLLTGGISEAELRAAGAITVYEDPAALTAHLDELLESLARSR